MKLPKLNDEASVSVYLLICITIVIIGFVWVMFGSMMDTMTILGNRQITGSAFHTSYERVNTMQWLQVAFNGSLVFTIIALIIWGIVVAIRERSGEVI